VVLSFENSASCIFQCAMISMLDAQSPLGRSGGHFNHGRNMIFPMGQERQARQVIYEPAGIDHIHRETMTVSNLAMRTGVRRPFEAARACPGPRDRKASRR